MGKFMNGRKKALAFVAAVAMALSLGMVAFADEAKAAEIQVDDAAKTVVVSGGGTGIQDAIDAIVAKTDPTGWTVQVGNGTYDRFTVPHWNKSGIADLSIVGESKEGVVVNVLNDEAYADNGLTDNGGINIYGTNVLLKDMTIKAGTVKKVWDDAAISTNHGMSGGADVSLTVDNCVLSGPGIGNGATYGIFWACSGMNVTNCQISGFANAIEYMNDGFNIPSGETYHFTNNTIESASFAIHGYMGGGNGGGILQIKDNVITGTDELRSKVICQDNVANSFVVDIRDNILTNTVVGLVNLQDEGDVLYDVLSSNAMGKNCFYVEAIEPGTIDFYTQYNAPQGDYTYGRWTLTGIDDFEVDWGKNPDGSTAYIQEKVDDANAQQSGVLSLTGIDENNLIKTFTWFKDGIYWENYENGKLTVSKEVTGEYADLEDEFTFTVELVLPEGQTMAAEQVYGDMLFVDGVATFTLKNGESVTAEGIPAGATYKVTEEEVEGYTVVALGDEGVIEANEEMVAAFTNDMSTDPNAPNNPGDQDDPSNPDGTDGSGGNGDGSSDPQREKFNPEDADKRGYGKGNGEFAKTSDPMGVIAPVIGIVAVAAIGLGAFALRRKMSL